MKTYNSILSKVVKAYRLFTVLFVTTLVFRCKNNVEAPVVEIAKRQLFKEAPSDAYDAMQKTFALYDHNLKKGNFFQTFMEGLALVEDSHSRQAYSLFTESDLPQMLFLGATRARVETNLALNLDEINKFINSEKVSKSARKQLYHFSKGLEKLKENSSKASFDMDKEIMKEIDKLEKEVSKDRELKREEKEIFLGLTNTLKKSYGDIKKVAQTTLENGRVSCWVCSVINVIVTVLVVTASVAVVAGVTAWAILSLNDQNPDSTVIAAVAIVGGLASAISQVLQGHCILISGQNGVNSSQTFYDSFGILWGPCF